MKNLNTNKVFVSVYQNVSKAENEQNHAKALEMLNREGVRYHVVTGFWKGVPEQSIMLESTNIVTHQENLGIALGLASLFRQEAVLEVLNDNTALIHTTMSAQGKKIGLFQEVSKQVALTQDSYTYDEASNRYFIVIE